jgi:hypothetical protein
VYNTVVYTERQGQKGVQKRERERREREGREREREKAERESGRERGREGEE